MSVFSPRAAERTLCDVGWQFARRNSIGGPDGASPSCQRDPDVSLICISWNATTAAGSRCPPPATHYEYNLQLVDAYAASKRELARQHHDDRQAYTAAKAELIERVLHDVETNVHQNEPVHNYGPGCPAKIMRQGHTR
ncbi:MAG: GrpB family protein [Egibacteraceae bacterium]